MSEPLVLRFHTNTIKHLGISLYSTLPPVIAELIANCYDANAKNVNVFLNDKDEKSIIIVDDGDGMSYEDLRIKYLEIGRNRREDQTSRTRKPIGKKGLGKLSVFGIAEKITIETVLSLRKNTIQMLYSEIIKSENGVYHPIIIKQNEEVSESDKTIITLENLIRKSPFNVPDLARNLSKRFTIFNDDFQVRLIYNNEQDKSILLTDRMRYDALDVEFTWELPFEEKISEYEFESEVKGNIFTTKRPTPEDMKGIVLTSRGKLVNQREFYGSKDDDYAYTYMSGWLSVDFIEDFDKDIIGTNRESLNWEDEDGRALKDYLGLVLKRIKSEWREKRKQNKKETIKRDFGFDIDEWLSELPTGDRKIAQKISNIILGSESIDTQKSCELLNYVQGSFEFESFKYYAEEMSNLDEITQEQLIKLIEDWELVEARELYNLSQIRIKAIENFEKHIQDNSLEYPTINKFLENFPWILDPKILKFENEITYAKILKEHFSEDNIPDENRRLDFLCVDFVENFFIIELKRPNAVISNKELDQALEYVAFIEERLSNEYTNRQVTAYVVGNRLVRTKAVIKKAESYAKSGTVFVKPYSVLLAQAQRYHRELIEKYQRLRIRRKLMILEKSSTNN